VPAGSVSDAGSGVPAGSVSDAGSGVPAGSVSDAGSGVPAGSVSKAGSVMPAGSTWWPLRGDREAGRVDAFTCAPPDRRIVCLPT